MFIEISPNLQENNFVTVSFFNKVAGLSTCNFVKKETQEQVFFCEFYEISRNIFSYRTSPLAFSDCHETQTEFYYKTISEKFLSLVELQIVDH